MNDKDAKKEIESEKQEKRTFILIGLVSNDLTMKVNEDSECLYHVEHSYGCGDQNVVQLAYDTDENHSQLASRHEGAARYENLNPGEDYPKHALVAKHSDKVRNSVCIILGGLGASDTCRVCMYFRDNWKKIPDWTSNAGGSVGRHDFAAVLTFAKSKDKEPVGRHVTIRRDV